MARTGPYVLETAGDEVAAGGRILAVLWDGAGTTLTNGQRVVVRARLTGELLWQAQYPDNVGINVGPTGIAVPNGYYVDRLDAGQVLVYMREES